MLSRVLLVIFIVLSYIAIRLIIESKKEKEKLINDELDKNKIISKLDLEKDEKQYSIKRTIDVFNQSLSEEEKVPTRSDEFMKAIKEKEQEEKRQNQNKDDIFDIDSTDIMDAVDGVINIIDNINPLDKLEKLEEIKRDMQTSDFLGSIEINQENKIYEAIEREEMKDNGYNFNLELFKKWAKEIFEYIQIGNLEEKKQIKDFLTEEFYDNMIKQDTQLENDGLKYIKEDFTIDDFKFLDYSKSLHKEEIKIFAKTLLREYIIDNNTKKILRGNRKLKEKKFILTFIKNNDKPETLEKNCPNCGAAISEIDFNKCKYCDTLLMPIRYNWTLIKIETT